MQYIHSYPERTQFFLFDVSSHFPELKVQLEEKSTFFRMCKKTHEALMNLKIKKDNFR